jgi:hypothetical protein
MKTCKSFNESSTDEELINQVKNLKEEILSHNNPYIKALLGVS